MKKAEAAGNRDSTEADSVSSTVVSTLMMENLKMEKLLAACYQVSSVARNLAQNSMCLLVL